MVLELNPTQQFFLKITPAFVREAYSLLKQSIIHIEQDDVEVDVDEADDPTSPPKPKPDLDINETNDHEPGQPTPNIHVREVDGPVQPKQKMKITHDEYATMQSMIILHLSSHERLTGRGIDRDELIDWYLEQKEEDMRDVDQLEYQNELIKKVLKKLVKV